jgi:MscS family membrane protein
MGGFSMRCARTRFATAFALLLLVLGTAQLADAQPTVVPQEPLLSPVFVPPPPPTSQPKGPDDTLGRGTPREAIRGFLDAVRESNYTKAADYLDLRRIPAALRSEEGAEFAKQLQTVLDKTLWFDVDDLSDDPQGNTEDGLPARTERIGTIAARDGAVDVTLARVPREDGQLIWKISADTVRHVPALYDEFGLSPFVAQLPPVLLETRLFDVALWQWIGILALILIAAASSWLFEIVLRRIVLFFAGRSASAARRLLDVTAGPLRFILALLLFQAGKSWLGLPLRTDQILNVFEGTLWVVAATWAALRFVEGTSQRIVRRLTERGQLSATALVPVGRRMARFVLYVIGALFLLRSFGVNVTALVAGLGVGGLAVALAAQKTLENLFGGITLIADAPVRVGDVCRFGDKVGTLEDIGLRSTRIRTVERTVIAIPNAEFSALQLENLARRDRFLLKTLLRLRPPITPAQMRSVLNAIQRLLAEQELIDRNSASARMVGFAVAAVEIEIHAYVRTNDADQFSTVREELLLGVMDAVQEAGAVLA